VSATHASSATHAGIGTQPEFACSLTYSCLLLWLVCRRGLRLLHSFVNSSMAGTHSTGLFIGDPVHSHGSFFLLLPVHTHGLHSFKSSSSPHDEVLTHSLLPHRSSSFLATRIDHIDTDCFVVTRSDMRILLSSYGTTHVPLATHVPLRFHRHRHRHADPFFKPFGTEPIASFCNPRCFVFVDDPRIDLWYHRFDPSLATILHRHTADPSSWTSLFSRRHGRCCHSGDNFYIMLDD